MKKQKQKSHKKHNRRKGKDKQDLENTPSTWVDRLLEKWVPVEGDSNSNMDCDVSIISWNVLADAYCSPRSHKHLPLKYQRHIFDRHQRQHHVRQTLRRMSATLEPDIFALQEVDPPLEVPACMKELGYKGVQTPSCPAGKDGRVDACTLFFRQDRWKSLEVQSLRLDDLATRASKDKSTKGDQRMNLQGVQTSFIRKNMALLVRLENVESKTQIIVAVMHFYWNPSYEYVKLCQAHCVASAAKELAGKLPVVFVGDFNSQPKSFVHRYLTKGCVNARMVAPWYQNATILDSKPAVLPVEEQLGRLQLEENSRKAGSRPQVRYLLDFTLNRLCRWLRILGIDSVLETEEEEQLRTKERKFTIFERCLDERRTLVTTSTSLLRRKNCPPGAYLLDTQSLLNLEQSLVHMLLSHGVVLEPKRFLTRCVVCNGMIERVHDEESKQAIFLTHQAPEALNDEVFDVFQCNGCAQGYWWCDLPTSSASRIKNQATKLLEMCIHGNIPLAGDMAMFDFVDVEKVKRDTPQGSVEAQFQEQRLDVLEWLQDEKLQNPLGALTSAYATSDGDEVLPFTNVTADFVGHLDYVMFQESQMEVTGRLYVPTSYDDLNGEGVHHGHLLPSCVWPSDHCAIGARLSIRNHSHEQVAQSDSVEVAAMPPGPPGDLSALLCFPVPPPRHGPRCACGCVPNIPSLFEMAELRRQARAKQSS